MVNLPLRKSGWIWSNEYQRYYYVQTFQDRSHEFVWADADDWHLSNTSPTPSAHLPSLGPSITLPQPATEPSQEMVPYSTPQGQEQQRQISNVSWHNTPWDLSALRNQMPQLEHSAEPNARRAKHYDDSSDDSSDDSDSDDDSDTSSAVTASTRMERIGGGRNGRRCKGRHCPGGCREGKICYGRRCEGRRCEGACRQGRGCEGRRRDGKKKQKTGKR